MVKQRIVCKAQAIFQVLFYYLYNVNAASMQCGYSVVVHIRNLQWDDTKLRRTFLISNFRLVLNVVCFLGIPIRLWRWNSVFRNVGI